jgi:hypothetical protein
MNVRALALQQNPGLSSSTKRGVGKCFSRIQVDEEALSVYMAENLQQLTEKAERTRASARKQRGPVVGEVPLSNQDWPR